MKRNSWIRICLATLVAGVVMLVVGFGITHERPQAPAANASLSAAIPDAWPEQVTIDISDLTHHLHDMPQKEVDDQLRDWAVYGTLVQSGVGDDELARTLAKGPPIRLKYLDEAFLFDHGRGRRAIVGDKAVLLFYDKTDPDPKATLGRLGDKVRMETGEIPTVFEVFEIDPDLAAGQIRCERKHPIAGSAMFGREYGYVEHSIADLEDFEAWLGEIDDVVMATSRGLTLVLGGRRFEHSRTRGVTVEDVAALYQAHEKLAEPRAAYERELGQINAEYKDELQKTQAPRAVPSHQDLRLVSNGKAQMVPGQMGQPSFNTLWDHGPQPANPLEEAIRAKYVARAEALEPVPEAPGFSLDPQWNPAGLAEMLEKIANEPLSIARLASHTMISHDRTSKDRGTPIDATPYAQWKARNVFFALLNTLLDGDDETTYTTITREYGAVFRQMAQDVRAAGKDLKAIDRAMLPLWKLQEKLRHELNGDQKSDATTRLLLATVEFVQANQVQCARYDGPLAGTRVGMTLFYTDLLAKLWESVDYHHSAPAAFVPGFLSGPRMRLEPEWREEMERLRSTRIWFGPKSESYTRSTDGDTLWLEHIATRVFAAGSNPAEPGKEEQPAEASRRAIGWWDRHYADVADFEQEYHVQNQIQKWSLITAVKRSELYYLSGVAVKADDRFDRWYARESHRLRYQHPMALRPERDWVTGTECIDLLASYPFDQFDDEEWQISGGVSLAGKTAVGRLPKISMSTAPNLRSIGAAAEGSAGAGRALPRYVGSGRITVDLPRQAVTRAPTANLGLQKVEVAFQSGAKTGIRVAIKSDRGMVGSLVARQASNRGVWLSWRSGQVANGVKPTVVRPFEGLAEGSYRNSLKSLAEASHGNPSQLGNAAKALEARTVSKADDLLRAGNSAAARQGYRLVGKELGGASPKLQMRQALAELDGGNVRAGVARLSETTARSNPELQGMLAKLEGNPRFKETRAFFEARTDPTRKVFGVPADRLRLEAVGAQARTVLRLDQPLKGKLVTVPERGNVLARQPEVTVYLDDKFRLNRVDWEASSNGTLTELAKSPKVRWKQVEVAGETFSPGVVVEGDVRYIRMPDVHSASVIPVLPPPSMVRPSLVVMIRDCDADGDGDVTDEERAACEQ